MQIGKNRKIEITEEERKNLLNGKQTKPANSSKKYSRLFTMSFNPLPPVFLVVWNTNDIWMGVVLYTHNLPLLNKILHDPGKQQKDFFFSQLIHI